MITFKKFAVTLQYYSPKAYIYVREQFNNALPHPRTLSRWYMAIDGQPGFTKESFDTLTDMANNEAKEVQCNLVIDEMSIRKQVEMDSNRNIYGFVNLDTFNDASDPDKTVPEAKNALVFLLVGVNGYWKLPIGYFLIDGLSGNKRANLLEKAIELISQTGVKLNSLTFDGASVNMTMVSTLGADLNNITYIMNSYTNEPIYIFLDAAHMIKLVRNAWGDSTYKTTEKNQSVRILKELRNSNKQLIKWAYIEKLYYIENEKGLRAGTKLTKRHLHYSNEKMNVRLAAQTLSKSVADALEFLKTEESYFEDVDATVEFITYMNNAFDILNSRSKFSNKPYNKPISFDTVTIYKDFTNKFIQYVEGLEFIEYKNDQPIVIKVLKSSRKTGFLGLILGLKNAIHLYEFIVAKNYMTYLLTYKLSQDHIETTFSAIRSRGGHNNNPTCRQFEAAYKRILVHNQVVGSIYGNCTILDGTKYLTVTASNKQTVTLQSNDNLIDHDYFDIVDVGNFIENISYYIAGFVARSVAKNVECTNCLRMLTADKSSKSHYTKLFDQKNRATLTNPSEIVRKMVGT